jgi:hypothetical protein
MMENPISQNPQISPQTPKLQHMLAGKHPDIMLRKG